MFKVIVLVLEYICIVLTPSLVTITILLLDLRCYVKYTTSSHTHWHTNDYLWLTQRLFLTLNTYYRCNVYVLVWIMDLDASAKHCLQLFNKSLFVWNCKVNVWSVFVVHRNIVQYFILTLVSTHILFLQTCSKCKERVCLMSHMTSQLGIHKVRQKYAHLKKLCGITQDDF